MNYRNYVWFQRKRPEFSMATVQPMLRTMACIAGLAPVSYLFPYAAKKCIHNGLQRFSTHTYLIRGQ